jgi:hypothetical protein
MVSLLEVLLTFAGVMLMLALVAERLQEILKASFALKSGTRLAAVRQLVIESARAKGLLPTDGQQIFDEVVERLRNLGQNGLRRKAVRLDALDKCQLSQLIAVVNHAKVSGLSGGKDDDGKDKLREIGQQAEQWFDLAVDPVDDRHRRRMQLWALGTALVVVGALNADAFGILNQARNDPAYRQAVAAQAAGLQHADSVVKLLGDSAAAAAKDSTTADSLRAKVAARRDTAVTRRDNLMLSSATGPTRLFAGYPKGWRFSWQWLLGMLLSAILVSLGAPFWHDVLESVLGLKNRIQLEASGKGGAGAAKP